MVWVILCLSRLVLLPRIRFTLISIHLERMFILLLLWEVLSTINWIELICLQNFYSHTLLITEKEMILLLRCN